MRVLFLILLTGFIIHSSFAQDKYVFKVDSVFCPEINQHDCQEVPFLGKDLSLKIAQFCSVYTREVDCGPPAYHSSIEIDKPDLYYSIQKLSKYYKKALKKGILDQEDAEKELQDIIDKCIAIHSLETDPIEDELKSAGNPEEILSVFHKIILE